MISYALYIEWPNAYHDVILKMMCICHTTEIFIGDKVEETGWGEL